MKIGRLVIQLAPTGWDYFGGSWSKVGQQGNAKSVKEQLKRILIGLGDGGGRFCGSPFPLKVIIDIVVFLFFK